ncbi:carboxypeptidase regulatory-like domain-containing protein [Gimesia sp.]|uniref:carboxypeptidase regulatory-like domain-containing protein n=1 Tax=Gimesia sp. TaxID=2024833 RepID=UPI003A8C9B68
MAESLNKITALLNHYGERYWNFSSAMFVQVCILVVVLFLVDLCLRQKVRAVTRYWLWSLVLIKLVLPVTLYSPASIAYWLTDYLPETAPVASAPLEAAPVETSPVVVKVEPTEAFKPQAIQSKSLSSDRLSAPAMVPEVTPAPAKLPPTVSSTASVPPLRVAETREAIPVPYQRLNPAAMLLIAWMSVVVVLCGFVVRRTRQVRQLIHQAEEASPELLELMNDCCQLSGLKQHVVRLKISDRAGSPAICGLWKPTIILPRHLLNQLDHDQLRQVFVHELAHWKRFDLQLNCLQTLLLILYFYNPLVWLAHSMLRRLREQAVDEAVLVTLKVQSQHYSSTLLDIAALTSFPDRLSLQLIGILEPRKPLAQRIRRIISRPVPRSARLGLVGFATILFAGVLLLPMSRLDRSQAAVEPESKQDNAAKTTKSGQEPESGPTAATTTTKQEPDRKSEPPAQPKKSEVASPAPQGILSGRIVDPTGAPVTDAEVTLLHRNGGRLIQTKTDQEGRYLFAKIDKPGEYRMMIKSQRWVGVEHSRDCPRVVLSFNRNTVQDVTLERACRLQIETVDEQGKPVPNVTVYAKSLTDTRGYSPETNRTDRTGQVRLGLKPSEFQYQIATSSPDYGFEKLIIKLDDPEKIVKRQIVQRKGTDVKGKVLCSDGKPPAGWKIIALPDWWTYGRSPSGYEISKDGSFSLPHIVDDVYNVTVSVPSGGRGFSPRAVLSSSSLLKEKQPLSLKLDYPSPASLVSLSGKINFSGDPQEHRGFWIFAESDDPRRRGSIYIPPGKTEFRLDPIQRGKYRLELQSPNFELKGPREVSAPSENITLDVVVKGKPKLEGTVVSGNPSRLQKKYQVRAIKIRTLRGPNFVQSPRWQDVDNVNGKFEVEVNGPGIYRVEVAASGFAQTLSEPINTDEYQGKPIQVKLTKGVSLSGTVVNEQGQPVNGATVIPLSRSRGMMPPATGMFTTEVGAVKTVDGKFTLTHLDAGPESLKVTHPDYTFVIVKEINLAASPIPDIKVTLKRGGTVQGLVTDMAGKPEPNVTLFFQDNFGYSGNTPRDAGRLATVITDEKGEYSVAHLPEQLCYVLRAEEWNSNGVVRQAILPENGKTSTLNLGGQPELTGRLNVNGVPLSKTRLLLAGDTPNFGIFRAYTITDGDGAFQFYGAGPAKRTLYYEVADQHNEWVRVDSFQLLAKAQDLGTIEQKIGKLTVKCTPEATDKLRLKLQTYNPVWTFGLDTGILAPRQNKNEPYVFNLVPPGEYELIAQRPGFPAVRKQIRITPETLNATVTLALPDGMSTLQGKLDESLCGPGGCSSLKLWSEDRQLLTHIYPDQKGNFAARHIPAGNYFLTSQDVRNPTETMPVSLKTQETKSLNLTPDDIKNPSGKMGFRVVNVFTQDGVPLPGCDLQLKNGAETLSLHSQQNERYSFIGTPGMYELTASYPGFATQRQQVELITSGVDGRYPDTVVLTLRLKPLDK